MNREIIETKNFTKTISSLLKKRQLLNEDYADFKRELAEHPDSGDIVPGTGGIRKARLKSASRGKSGGFRVCYYDISHKDRIYLIAIYPKNEQENISMEDKKALKGLVGILKGTNK